MPPRIRFPRDQIIESAFNLVREKGMDALSARSLAAELGCSPQPIFSEFQNMDEVRSEVKKASVELYYSYILGKGADSDAFRRTDYIRFAKDEPKLFSLMFMQPRGEYTLKGILLNMFNNMDDLINAVHKDYAISIEDSFTLCSTMLIFIHGIACLCATGMSSFDEKEMAAAVEGQFTAVLKSLIKV